MNLESFNKISNHIESYFDWSSLSSFITFDIVKDNLDKPWDYDALSRNPNITWNIVTENPDIPWGYRDLSRNPNITWDIV